MKKNMTFAEARRYVARAAIPVRYKVVNVRKQDAGRFATWLKRNRRFEGRLRG